VLGWTETFAGLEDGDPMVIEHPHALGTNMQGGYDLWQVLGFGEEGKDGGGFFAWVAPPWPPEFGRHGVRKRGAAF
jgi:hypothetical protein